METLINLSYIIASILFIYGLRMLGKAETARRGNQVSALGMLLAIVITLFVSGMSYTWIIVGLAIGSIIGIAAAAKIKMTQMPEMVALLNGSGGLASLLVAGAEYLKTPNTSGFTAFVIFLAIVIGGMTFTGSVLAFAKLSERIKGSTQFKGQQLINVSLLVLTIVFGICFTLWPQHLGFLLIFVVIVAFALGILAVLPIGGADMPIVVSLLNSYSGIAASMAGFIINNTVLIVAGSLVGASGLILTSIMCKAMNRSLANVLFSGFGSAKLSSNTVIEGEAKSISAEDAYFILEAAAKIIIVPGYGMAVAQAQHVVKELADLLEDNGAEVSYAIHPVAGRMPGHMNVLLAEANVPYEQLVEPDHVNPTMEMVDVAIVIGANDVVNPAAKEDSSSPLFGMPIIETHRARTVFVLKRSMNPGFSGVQNPLFFKDNTRMLFGDAKAMISTLVNEFKDSA